MFSNKEKKELADYCKDVEPNSMVYYNAKIISLWVC
jgi:hypothetical protein